MTNYKIHLEEDSKGILKTSFVAVPAIQSQLIFLSEDKMEVLKFQNEERGIIYAPALIPNKLIARKNINGSPANVYFDKETILKMHMNGCKNNYDQKINLNHDQESDIKDVYCFESWIIENSVNDKSVHLGFDLPIGTLMKGYKIDNEEIKQDIKSGKITGLSIEFLPDNFIEKETLNFKKENMNKKTIIEKIIALFADEKTEYATGVFGTSLGAGSIITDADGNPLADKEFEFDGKKYKTDSEGKVSEMEVELEGETPPAEDDKDAKITALETEIADLKAQLVAKEEMKMANETVETELATLKLSNETQATEIIKLTADIVEAKKVQAPAPVAKLYSEMTNKEKALYNRGKL